MVNFFRFTDISIKFIIKKDKSVVLLFVTLQNNRLNVSSTFQTVMTIGTLENSMSTKKKKKWKTRKYRNLQEFQEI